MVAQYERDLSRAEVELYVVRGPGGDASAEEVAILSPERAVEEEGCGEDGPVVEVAALDAGTGFCSMVFVEAAVDDLESPFEVVENAKTAGRIHASAKCDGKHVFSSLIEADVRNTKDDMVFVSFDQVQHANTEDGA